MEYLENILLSILVLIMFVSVGVLYACSIFVRNLSEYETEEWNRLGSPKSIFINKHGGNLLNYITAASYRALADSNVVKSGNVARALLYLHGAIFISFVITLLLKALLK